MNGPDHVLFSREAFDYLACAACREALRLAGPDNPAEICDLCIQRLRKGKR